MFVGGGGTTMANVNIPGGQPLFDLASYGRGGPTHRDRFSAAEIALSHHRGQVAIAQPVSDVPANTQLDGFR